MQWILLCAEPYLWRQLKLAVLSQEEELANRWWIEIHDGGYCGQEENILLFRDTTDEELGLAIGLLKEQCSQPPTQSNDLKASRLILAIALFT